MSDGDPMRSAVLHLSCLCLCLTGLGPLVPVSLAQTTDRAIAVPRILTKEQKRRAEQLTSLFENDTLEIQYGYCAALKDGRGFTAGRAGFTTSTDEVYQVVKVYTEKRPDNVLAPFLPRLKELADEESASTSGLNGFPAAWKKAGDDPLFRSVQDKMVEELFWAPTLRHAQALGVRTPLGMASLHDTIIQHGNDDDPDGLPALLRDTRKELGGTPATGIDEKLWLRTFLRIRQNHLSHAHEPETREEWRKSLDRCLVFEAIAQSGNYSLSGPIIVKSRDHEAVIP